MKELLVIFLCLFLNALLAAFEMAFVTVSRSELRRQIQSGSKIAQCLLDRRSDPERTLSTIQIGITLVAALAAVVGGVGGVDNFKPWLMQQWGMGELGAESLAVLLVVLPLTYLTVVLGELIPKSLALRSPGRIALCGTRWIALADTVLSPLVRLLEGSTKKILRLCFPKAPAQPYTAAMTIEIESLPPSHQQAVMNLAFIEHRRIRDCYLPWKNVTFVRTTDSLETITPVVFASGHTRLPVMDGNTVTGVLHTKEFLAYRETGGRDWQNLVRPMLRVREDDTVLPVFRAMQSQHSQMAMVFSETGERLGVITLEDILEEIVGEIYDEDEDSRIRKIFADKVKTRGKPPR